MFQYTCYDVDRKLNWYLLTVQVTFDKKGARSDNVVRVVHLGSSLQINLLSSGQLQAAGHSAHWSFGHCKDMTQEQIESKRPAWLLGLSKTTSEDPQASRARTLQHLQEFDEAQKKLEATCKEQGIPVPVMIC